MYATSTFLVRQNDTNLWDGLFGGKLMSEVDICGYYAARRALVEVEHDFITTAGFSGINFMKPAFVGDLITLIAQVSNVGNSSLQVDVAAHRETAKGEVEQIMDAQGTYVCMKEGKPQKHNLVIEAS